MTPLTMAVAALAALLLLAGAGLIPVLVAALRRQRVLERRVARVAAAFPGHAAQTDSRQEDVLILRSQRDRGRIRGWIAASYPLIHAPSALPKAVGLGVVGGAAAVAASWFLRVPFDWWTPVIFAAAGAAASWLAMARLQKQAGDAFVEKFPELVDQIVRLSATGVPVVEAVASVTEHAPPAVKPVVTVFSDYLTAGIDPEEAARAVSKRFRVAELTMFMAVIRLQRRSGGGVTAAFSNLSQTLRDRRRAGLHAKAATAQTRFTLLILAALPFVLLGVQFYTSPGSIEILFETDVGTQLLRWGFALIAGGLYVARTIAANAAR